VTITLDLDDPSAVVVAAVRALDTAGIDALVYGGMALATYGEPRETKDADLAVFGVSASAGRVALEAIGVSVVLAFDSTRFGGLSISRLSLLGGGKLNMVDLVTPRSQRYASALMQRPIRGTLDGQPLRIVAPEDFVLLKVLSTRERDLEDARTVLAALAGRLDDELIEREANGLASEIADHDVLGRYRAIRT
jgi:hypothetical protein